eukprot:sb/3468373/
MSSESDYLTPSANYTLKLGPTWDHIPSELVHGVQYDFKPASVNAKQAGQMKLSGKSDVSVILPHRDNNECLEFQGNRQLAQKDCFLVVDEATKTVTLERISNMIRVKKHRSVSKKTIKSGVKRDEPSESSPSPSLPSSSSHLETRKQHTPSPTPDPTPTPPPAVAVPPPEKQPRISAPPPPPPANNLSEDDSSGSDSDMSSSGESGADSGGGGESGVVSSTVITPLGQPDKVVEGDQGSNKLIEILSRDLDMTSDEDDEDDD